MQQRFLKLQLGARRERVRTGFAHRTPAYPGDRSQRRQFLLNGANRSGLETWLHDGGADFGHRGIGPQQIERVYFHRADRAPGQYQGNNRHALTIAIARDADHWMGVDVLATFEKLRAPGYMPLMKREREGVSRQGQQPLVIGLQRNQILNVVGDLDRYAIVRSRCATSAEAGRLDQSTCQSCVSMLQYFMLSL